MRIDCLNAICPTDAWVTLATVTLTNSPQLYFDLTAFRQAPRLYRLVPLPQEAAMDFGMPLVAGKNALPTSFIFQKPVESSTLFGRGHIRNELGEILVVSSFVRCLERPNCGKQ